MRRIGLLILGAVWFAATAGYAGNVRPEPNPSSGSPPANARLPDRVDSFIAAISQTAAVIEGTVTDISYAYSEEKGPWTLARLSSVKAYFGSAPAEVVIRQFGGPVPGGKLLVVSHMTRFVKGAQYVVFLRNTAWNLSPVVGDLALRVEQVAGGEMLVNHDGAAVIGIASEGCRFSRPLFEVPDMNGAPPKMIEAADQRLPQALNRELFIRALAANLTARRLTIAGDFHSQPAVQLRWKGVSTRADGHGASSPGWAQHSSEPDIPPHPGDGE